MRKKKLLSLGIALAMITGLAAGGCAQKGSGSTSDSSGAQKQESSEPVELEFLFGDPNRTEIFSRIVEDFNNSQDGVHVTFNATGTNHLEELMTRLAADDAPDLTSQLQGFELASYVDAGYIKDIKNEPFMKYIRDTELDTVTIEDGVYGIPMDTQAWGVFYNKELFEKAGISDVPVTVSELKDCVEKLKASGITPFAAGYATEWTIGQFLGYGASSILTRLR